MRTLAEIEKDLHGWWQIRDLSDDDPETQKYAQLQVTKYFNEHQEALRYYKEQERIQREKENEERMRGK